jgi:F-box and WD-40 domain protein CDC4
MDPSCPVSLTDRRATAAPPEVEVYTTSPSRSSLPLLGMPGQPFQLERLMQTRNRGPPTPNLATPAELVSPTQSSHDPPAPPTPAASPTLQDVIRPDWSDATDEEDIFLAQIRQYFKHRSDPERTRILGDLLNLCTSRQLSFVSSYVSPLLKKDPFLILPDELCLRVSCVLSHCFSHSNLLTFLLGSVIYQRRKGIGKGVSGVASLAGFIE